MTLGTCRGLWDPGTVLSLDEVLVPRECLLCEHSSHTVLTMNTFLYTRYNSIKYVI